MTLADAEVAHWRTWIGRTEAREDLLDAEVLRRFAAAIGEPLDVELRQPSLGHWAYFLPVVPDDRIGIDGHPRRGGFLPPVSLPRRMFAAGDLQFAAPLVLGRVASRRSTIADVVHRAGKSGELVIVTVDHRIEQDGALCITERQTIIYRDAGAATVPIVPAAQVPEGDVVWTPGSVELFRFSAVTFNSHRIHYDLPYATGEEGYPGLVVHGPFTATRLFGCATSGERRPVRFTFRAVAPLFAHQPIAFAVGPGEGEVSAIRCDGVTAMTATAAF